METRSISLDGPAGAGKSTLARRAAKHLGMIYVDTGALYRCIGLYALRKGVSPRDADGIASLLPDINLEMKYDDEGVQRMLMNSDDVTGDIRSPEASSYASDVSAIPSVRDFLLSMQRLMAEKYDVIMDGRDIGTVVLPNAGLKVFLTAELDVRAKRRHLELLEKDPGISLDKVRDDMRIRDKNDSEREVAPLKPAEDSIILDTTYLDADESFDAFCGLVYKRFGK
ncbi:MAG: (d)CMP kinase [Oscillospiraceae bacterium]|nr:(d)CMP kinase [Oscillospiraceae bacterium]